MSLKAGAKILLICGKNKCCGLKPSKLLCFLLAFTVSPVFKGKVYKKVALLHRQ